MSTKAKVENYLIKQAISDILPQRATISEVLIAEEKSINKQILVVLKRKGRTRR